MLKSGILDINGTEVKAGDVIVLPWIDPIGNIHERFDEHDERVKVVFDHGCFGYYLNSFFYPLFEWQLKEKGEYIPNVGIGVKYTKKYPFLVEK